MKFCSERSEVEKILSTPNTWRNSEVLYVFSEIYDNNVCVHIHNSKHQRVDYAHYEANQEKEFIHLKLKNAHYTPLFLTDFNGKDITDHIYESDYENFPYDKADNFLDQH